MTYRELLESPEWVAKRTQIVGRDNRSCKACSNIKLIQELHCAYINLEWPSSGPILLGHALPTFKAVGFYNSPEFLRLPPYLIVYYTDGPNFPNIHLIREMVWAEVDEYIHNTTLVTKLADFMVSHVEAEAAQYRTEKEVSYVPKHIMDRFQDDASKTDDWKQIREENSERHVVINDTTYQTLKYCKANGLNVHHTFYQRGRLPWEYPDETLETYCRICHIELHASVKVPELDENGIQIGMMTPCPRCAGAGELPEYKHVDRGICFQCNGAQYVELT